MPHISMSRSCLWLSYNSDVNCYLRKANGKLKYYSAGSLKNPNLKTSDVSNFAVHKDRAVVVYRLVFIRRVSFPGLNKSVGLELEIVGFIERVYFPFWTDSPDVISERCK